MKDDNTIKAIIARIPVWQNANEIRTERIAGLTNANYRVTVDGEQFVLRLSGENTERLGINRAHEGTALQAAAEAGLSPDVVLFLEPEGHLVTQWIDGRHWSADEFRTAENVHLLTETVKRIHALPTSRAEFSPFQRVQSFLETANKFGGNPPPGLEQFLSTMQAVEADQQHDPSDWKRFCHNDLVSVNYLFVERERKIIVLDWEFAGAGDIYYDLATIVYTHDSDGPIPKDLEDVMSDCYFGAVSAFQRRRLAGMKYMLMLFTGAWALAQQGMQEAGLIPPPEGFDYHEFGEYLFAHDIPELQAQYRQL